MQEQLPSGMTTSQTWMRVEQPTSDPTAGDPLTQPPRWRLAVILVGLLAACALFLSLLVTLGDADETGATARAGQLAPEIVGVDLTSGREMKLSGWYGRPVVVNFWATWCPPCKREMPLLTAAYSRYQQGNLLVLGLNLDPPMSKNHVQRFMDEVQINFPVVMDNREQHYGKLYQTATLPVTYFIDRSGVIRYIQLGEMTADQLEANLRLILPRGEQARKVQGGSGE